MHRIIILKNLCFFSLIIIGILSYKLSIFEDHGLNFEILYEISLAQEPPPDRRELKPAPDIDLREESAPDRHVLKPAPDIPVLKEPAPDRRVLKEPAPDRSLWPFNNIKSRNNLYLYMVIALIIALVLTLIWVILKKGKKKESIDF